MKDTLNKLRALVGMKTTLIDALQDQIRLAERTVNALRGDLSHALRLVRKYKAENDELRRELELQKQEWWMQQDQDEQWLRQFERGTENVGLGGQVDGIEPTTKKPEDA